MPDCLPFQTMDAQTLLVDPNRQRHEGPHAKINAWVQWANLADEARRLGNRDRAEGLIEIAYFVADVAEADF